MLILIALLFGEAIPPLQDFVIGAGAGLAGVIGLIALYKGLASGRAGIVAPVSGVVAAMIPIPVAILLGGLPSWLKLAGFTLALISVWFVSQGEHGRITRGDLVLPLIAGVGFGIFFILIHKASAVSIMWPLVGARGASVIVITLFAMVNRYPYLPGVRSLPLIMLCGILDVSGNAFYAAASHLGRVDTAVVLAALYPAATIIWAWLLLKESIGRAQLFGIVLAIVAIAMISA